MKTTHKAPSRIRYEATHPAITFRVPRDVYNRLQEYKKETGKTYSEIIAAGIEIDRKLREVFSNGVASSHDKSNEIPVGAYLETPAMLGTCKHCGRPIIWKEKDRQEFNRLWNMLYRETCPACNAAGLC